MSTSNLINALKYTFMYSLVRAKPVTNLGMYIPYIIVIVVNDAAILTV